MHPSRLAHLALAVPLLLAAPAANAAELLFFGEQHDQPDQQRQVAEEVRRLAARGRLAALVLEMAEAPHSTAGLPPTADEAEVRRALHWQGWPWDTYRQVVMNAVQAAVPVLGGNLPRAAMREAMADAALDTTLPPDAWHRIAQAVREGHCDLLPAAQQPGMVRIQIARDRSMARTVDAALRQAPADTVVMLLSGAMHASRDRGVPLHLADRSVTLHVVMFGDESAPLAADEHRSAVFKPRPDPCEPLRQGLAASAPGAMR